MGLGAGAEFLGGGGDRAADAVEEFAHMRGVPKLRKALHDRAFVAAAILLIGAAGIEHAEILKSKKGAIGAQIEGVDDERQRVLGKPVGWDIKPTFLGDLEAEE